MRTQSIRLFDHIQLARFGVVGLVNTAAGYLVIVIGLFLGAGDVLANATGYVVGLTLSYFLNSRWTFCSASRVGARTLIRYVAVFIVAYGVNLAIVFAGRGLGYPENPLVHLAGVGGYAVLFYIGAATFVFGNRATAGRQQGCRRGFPRSFWARTRATELTSLPTYDLTTRYRRYLLVSASGSVTGLSQAGGRALISW